MAVASAGPHANLHRDPDTNIPASHHSVFTGKTQNSQPFRSPPALRSSLTQFCALAQHCAEFWLGFPTSHLWQCPPGDTQQSLLAIFWVFWCKVKTTQADAPTIRMDCHPIPTNWCPHLCHPTIFAKDALPGTALPM